MSWIEFPNNCPPSGRKSGAFNSDNQQYIKLRWLQDSLHMGRHILYQILRNPLNQKATQSSQILPVIKSEPPDIKTEPPELIHDHEPNSPSHSNTVSKAKKASEETYACHICKDGRQMRRQELRQHFKAQHRGRNARYLKNTKKPDEFYSCEICSKEFRSIKSLEDHIDTHEDQYACDICNESFKKVLDYTLHLFKHSEDKTYKCQLCDYTTKAKGRIVAHIGGFHDLHSKYKCETCGKRFSVLTWFEEHKNFHTGQRPFVCEYCGKSFPYTRQLNSHKTNIHKEEMTGKANVFKCDFCGKEYKQKNNLKLHMLSHTGKQPICDVCGKRLTTPEKLKLHMRIHTGYKPFTCGYCPQTFVSKPRLSEHERIHTGERPYVCQFCGKAFTQRSSRKIHERNHTGEKPYSCLICSKTFVLKSQLNQHHKNCMVPN